MYFNDMYFNEKHVLKKCCVAGGNFHKSSENFGKSIRKNNQ